MSIRSDFSLASSSLSLYCNCLMTGLWLLSLGCCWSSVMILEGYSSWDRKHLTYGFRCGNINNSSLGSMNRWCQRFLKSRFVLFSMRSMRCTLGYQRLFWRTDISHLVSLLVLRLQVKSGIYTCHIVPTYPLSKEILRLSIVSCIEGYLKRLQI